MHHYEHNAQSCSSLLNNLPNCPYIQITNFHAFSKKNFINHLEKCDVSNTLDPHPHNFPTRRIHIVVGEKKEAKSAAVINRGKFDFSSTGYLIFQRALEGRFHDSSKVGVGE